MTKVSAGKSKRSVEEVKPESTVKQFLQKHNGCFGFGVENIGWKNSERHYVIAEDGTDYEVALTLIGKIMFFDSKKKDKNSMIINLQNYTQCNEGAVSKLLSLVDQLKEDAETSHPVDDEKDDTQISHSDISYGSIHFYSSAYDSVKVYFFKDDDNNVVTPIVSWSADGNHASIGWDQVTKGDIIAVDLRLKGYIYKKDKQVTVTNEVIETAFILKEDKVQSQSANMVISPKKKRLC